MVDTTLEPFFEELITQEKNKENAKPAHTKEKHCRCNWLFFFKQILSQEYGHYLPQIRMSMIYPWGNF
jgi:hypothetical protein